MSLQISHIGFMRLKNQNNMLGFGFEGFIFTRKVKRYTVNKNESEWDMNKLIPRKTKVIGESVNLDEYEIVSYQSGNALLHANKLTWKHFDFVQKVSQSKHPIKNEWAVSFIAFRNGKPTVLIAKKVSLSK